MTTRQPIQTIDLQSVAFKRDPLPTWRRLRALGPVVTTRQPLLGRVMLITQHAAARDILEDTALFTVDARTVGKQAAAGLRWWVPAVFRPLASNMLTHDGDEHNRLRGWVDGAFRGESLRSLDASIDQLAHQKIEDLLQHRHADFSALVARPLPQAVISELLGMSAASQSPTHPLNVALARLANIHTGLDLFRAVPAIRRLSKAVEHELQQRRVNLHAKTDLLSTLTQPDATHADDQLTPQEQLAMVFMLYVAGHETTTHLLNLSLLTLLQHGELLDALPDPVTTGNIAELCRALSPVQMTKPRFITQTHSRHGVEFRRGDTVAVLLASANTDPEQFDDAEAIRFDRKPSRPLAFGGGPHVCLGMQLALRETAATLTHWRRAFGRHSPTTCTLSADQPVEWSRRLGLRAITRLPVQMNWQLSQN